MRRLLCVPLMVLLFLGVACGGSSSGSSAAGGGGASGAGARSQAAVPTEVSGARTSRFLTREGGGELSIELSDGDRATLTVPAGALEEDTIVTLVPLQVPDGVGVGIEPSGLWLDRAATLRFARTDRSLLTRIAPAIGDDRFTLVATSSRSTAIVRFRPVLAVDRAPEGLVLPGATSGGGSGSGGSGRSRSFPADPRGGDADGPDAAAADIEQGIDPESTDAGTADTQGTTVRRAAATTAATMAEHCEDRSSAAAARFADMVQTAGSVAGSGPATRPKCVRRVLSVWANAAGQWNMGGSFSFDSTVEGHGLLTAADTPTEFVIPLHGADAGFEKGTSLLLSTFAAEVAAPTLGATAPPVGSEYCEATPLLNGSMTGTARLAGQSIELRMQPSGTFRITCNGKLVSEQGPAVWILLEPIGITIPITVTVPDGRNSVNVLNSLQIRSEVETRSEAGGRVAVSLGSEIVYSASLQVGIFWSRADRCQLTPEERAKGPEYERQVCGAGDS